MTYIFEKIDWDRFPFIETIKIDTEGNEKKVILSCKEYLDKVVYLRVECFKAMHGGDFINTADPMIEFLKEKGFENFDQEQGDYKFINIKHKQLANDLSLGY
jgi:hypothetical protein